MLIVRLRADVEPLVSALSELAESPLEFRQAAAGLLEAPQQIALIKSDALLAAGTNELVVRFDPSDRLLGVVAAARAGD